MGLYYVTNYVYRVVYKGRKNEHGKLWKE